MIYLDSAATSLLKPETVSYAVYNALNNMSSPGRGGYRSARLAADKVYECRELICRLCNFDKPERVAFTLNATHALNIAIRSLVKAGDRAVISGYEHNSVARVLNGIGAVTTVAESKLFDTEGTVEAFRRAIPGAAAVICNHVSNVFGFELPVYEISAICAEHGVPFIVDASQSAGVLDIDADRLNAAFIAMPGHKGLFGPQGTGVLICNVDAEPLLYGGTGSDSRLLSMPDYLPDMLEAGTHNTTGIAGLCEGIKYVLSEGTSKIGDYESALCRRMAENLADVEGLEIFASLSGNQTGVLSVRHKHMECEMLCEELAKESVAARCGLHCAPLAHISAGTVETGTLRMSFSPFLSTRQVDKASEILRNIIYKQN